MVFGIFTKLGSHHHLRFQKRAEFTYSFSVAHAHRHWRDKEGGITWPWQHRTSCAARKTIKQTPAIRNNYSHDRRKFRVLWKPLALAPSSAQRLAHREEGSSVETTSMWREKDWVEVSRGGWEERKRRRGNPWRRKKLQLSRCSRKQWEMGEGKRREVPGWRIFGASLF